MKLHHDKHHQAYVDNANKALDGHRVADASVEEVLRNLDQLPEDKRMAVRNNAGGHANHSLFWEIMGPHGGGEPTGELGERDRLDAFGSFDSFKETFNENGVTRFGSGWTWLVWNGSAPRGVLDSEPGHADPAGSRSGPRQRRVGARLLPELPKPPPGIPRGLVERRQLGRGRGPLRVGLVVVDAAKPWRG